MEKRDLKNRFFLDGSFFLPFFLVFVVHLNRGVKKQSFFFFLKKSKKTDLCGKYIKTIFENEL